MIYLDYAANTPVHEDVLNTFTEVSRSFIANPNSSHALGLAARQKLEDCTDQIKTVLQAQAYEVIYTSGASESNNLAIKGLAKKYAKFGRHIITTYLEHSSVNGAMEALIKDGFEVDYVDVIKDGLVDMQHLRELIRKDTILVSICHVDSEIGLTQQISRIGELLAAYPNCHFHTDATQSVGKIPVHLGSLDLLTFAPHKFYGLNGCGVLLKKPGVQLEPLIHGGVSTTPYRSGTPALGLIAATAKALELAAEGIQEKLESVRQLNRTLRDALRSYPGVRINSTANSVPFILNISIPGADTQALIADLEKQAIFLSAKSACCAPNAISRPVFALTQDKKAAASTVRISLSHLTTEEDVQTFLKSFADSFGRLV
ncbi:MAG: cysteine desulfurase family protein [Eubacteriales bacterium]